MFKELAPYLRQRAVLLTVTHIEDDQIRVNVIPQKLKDGENAALTTPVTVTGTAEELDRDLPATLVNFVSSHLELKNTLDRAKSEMEAAAKTAQAEARAKSKTTATRVAPKAEPAKAAETPKSDSPETGRTRQGGQPLRCAGVGNNSCPCSGRGRRDTSASRRRGCR